MKAIRQFADCFGGNLPHDLEELYMEALIILQGKAWVYYSILLNTDLIWTRAIPTAATDGAYVYVNPEFFRSLANASQRAFLLGHEVGHIILRHPARGQFYRKRGFHSMANGKQLPFDHRVFNQAADYVINADLKAHGLEMPECGLYDGKFTRDHLVDHVYIELATALQKAKEEAEQQAQQQAEADKSESGESESDESGQSGQSGDESESGESESGSEGAEGDSGEGEGEGSGSGSGESEGETTGSGDAAADKSESEPTLSQHGGFDDHIEPKYEAESEADLREQQEADRAEVQRKVDDALDSMDDAVQRGERHCGNSSAVNSAGFRHSGDGETGTVDWKAEFADLLTRTGQGGDVTWSKIHRRRYATLGIIAPTRVGTVNRLVEIVDVSGSVDRAQLRQQLLELSFMIDLLQPISGCLIVWCNTGVLYSDEVYSGQELLDLTIPDPSGGTRMKAGLDWCERNGYLDDADVVMCFTDGYCSYVDWPAFAETGTVVILDRHPGAGVKSNLDAHSIRYIVANDTPLAM